MDRAATRFLRKLALFLAPFVIVQLAETILFPIDAFTFRCWEALAVTAHPWSFLLAPPFYPNRRLEKVETGGLGHRTRFDEKSLAIWQTDAWGFRNGPGAGGRYDVVLVGDSFAVGTGVSQEDTLAAQLLRIANLRTYAYAPASLPAFLREERFRTVPRPIVIYQFAETALSRFIVASGPLASVEGADAARADYTPSAASPISTSIAVAVDRSGKGALLLSYRARLREWITAGVSCAVGGDPENVEALGPILGSDGETLFLFGRNENREHPAEVANLAVEKLVQFDRAMKESGFDFLLLPVPNKENIYYDLLPGRRRPDLLDQIIEGVRLEGVAVIDLQPPLRAARASGVLTYHRDDIHWNAQGVVLAAQALAERLPESSNRGR